MDRVDVPLVLLALGDAVRAVLCVIALDQNGVAVGKLVTSDCLKAAAAPTQARRLRSSYCDNQAQT